MYVENPNSRNTTRDSRMFSISRRQAIVSSRFVRYASTEPPIMAIVRQDLKTAMKSGDVTRKTTIRAVMAAIKNANIDKPDSVTTDIGFHSLVNTLIKKRQKSIEEYHAGNRLDLVEQEQNEIAVLEELQEKVEVASDEEIASRVNDFIKGLALDVSDKSSMGKIMSNISWPQVESEWKASQGQVVQAIKKQLGQRKFSTMRVLRHDNPLVCK
ncbi:Aim41p [Sugiyamaella lignohabitans]|uniref:Altered inheritance of mitochondria protein 41 n=1 Tax=Sugiyamaella lignohabitans TaxID=796027 RepID=A0A161HI73_9ASCO|nr:Aim41p [Sugiyamaella lignohabitans]ANB15970.1 Aim41p [Sugiyamaella lignohabitans]